MNRLSKLLFLAALSLPTANVAAEDVLATYQEAGPFSAERGEKLWHSDGVTKNGKVRNCSTCHGSDLTQKGKHARSGKEIEPMAPSVNPERFTEVKKVEKWFKRNCKWTLGRECTAQEKGDVLTYLMSL